MTERVEPTPDERRNGWSAESLAAYLAQRTAETRAFAKLQSERGTRIARAEGFHRFNPHDW